ncbi:MAG TPA: MgtC/SapB family protein [Spirochaetia bacterium]|nr:MgtC/SapB family protein [Spirochaetia bacterium]
MEISNSFQVTIAFRIFLAFLAGILIGFDRERSGKAAGLRTQMLVCIGSALFAGLSIYVANSMGVLGQDPTRIMAQIVSGVGFLGAGVILKNGNRLSGVTTAATIWTTAAVGTAIGAGFYIPAAITVVLILMLTPIAYLQYRFGTKGNSYLLSFNKKYEADIMDIFEHQHIHVIQKSIHKSEVHVHVMSNELKNEKLFNLFEEKEIKFSLEPTEE